MILKHSHTFSLSQPNVTFPKENKLLDINNKHLFYKFSHVLLHRDAPIRFIAKTDHTSSNFWIRSKPNYFWADRYKTQLAYNIYLSYQLSG